MVILKVRRARPHSDRCDTRPPPLLRPTVMLEDVDDDEDRRCGG